MRSVLRHMADYCGWVGMKSNPGRGNPSRYAGRDVRAIIAQLRELLKAGLVEAWTERRNRFYRARRVL